MLKPVTARPGDIVTVAHHVVYVNHHLLANSRIYSQDGLKRAMPQLADGEYIVKPGTLWAVSTYNPHSFDSRYFGPISDKEVIHHVVPVLFF
jgi:conjugative transfer signal peptidase TraF